MRIHNIGGHFMTHLVFRPFGSTVLNNRDNFISTFDKMFDEFARKDFPEFFQHFGAEPFGKAAYPKVNVITNDETVVIEAELAGYKKDEIDIEVKEGVLTISGGASQLNEQTDKVVYLLRELKRSSFSRSFKLGDQLDASEVDAKFDNGLLTITIQKLQKEPESKKVTIK
jgi:HSP20 family protein